MIFLCDIPILGILYLSLYVLQATLNIYNKIVFITMVNTYWILTDSLGALSRCIRNRFNPNKTAAKIENSIKVQKKKLH